MPPCRGAGRIVSPSSRSVTSAPSRPSSVASAVMRSVSWPRMCATPRRWEGESARAQRAATAGVSSPTSCRSRSTPDSRRRSDHGEVAVGQAHLAAHEGEDLAQLVAGLRGGGGPVGDGDPTAGGGREGEERGRVGQVGLDVVVDGPDRPGGDRPAVGVAVVDLDPVLAEHLHRHLDVGERRHRLADVAHVDAVVVAGAREQQRRDELRRGAGVDGDGASGHGARAVHGEGECAPAAVVDPDAERAAARSASGRRGAAACGGRRRSATVPSASPTTGGTKRITVPASPQSTSASRSQACRA